MRKILLALAFSLLGLFISIGLYVNSKPRPYQIDIANTLCSKSIQNWLHDHPQDGVSNCIAVQDTAGNNTVELLLDSNKGICRNVSKAWIAQVNSTDVILGCKTSSDNWGHLVIKLLIK